MLSITRGLQAKIQAEVMALSLGLNEFRKVGEGKVERGALRP